ncbi:unnamed protein product [Rotaria sordida]|uniref:Peptidase C51 domain-containing protein n=1 Tax=Rotaria sordida TaxID=392033 RepID=A0A816DMB8_9BILA|nr:unnamed protein product [Rotaria sordida]CAF1639286.1 unnamed protein product [Rotaria sordida]
MMTDEKQEIVPFNKVQGIASTNVPAYSNEYDDFISFEGSYLHGIYTGFKWQCVEFARRWLLLRKSCTFKNIGSAADIWQELTYVERITDGEKFPLKTYSNGSLHKPNCDTFLIYPRSEDMSHGHIAIICEVQENFIRVAEENYHFHYWLNNYARQIPMIYRNGLYYIEDYYNVYGWMEIENNHQLKPLDESNINLVLQKYQQSKPIGELKRCFILNKTFDHDYSSVDINNGKEKFLIQSNNKNVFYYQANEDFVVNISNTSNELYRLFMQTVDYIIHNDKFLTFFEIPHQIWFRIRRSWTDEHDFDIIDHMNFKFDGKHFKLYQYKSNQALTIFQSTIAQEKWAQDMNLNYDFTSSFQLHHLFVRQWKRLNIQTTLHILMDNDNPKDLEIILYMKTIMTEAGINSKLCLLSNDLYWKDSIIVDKDGEIIKIVWKLWNWKTIFQDLRDQYRDNKGGEEGWKSMNNERPCISDILLNEQIRIIEPLLKSIINHKAFFSVLYRMFSNHSDILQNECFSSEDSKHISFMNSSMEEQNNDGIEEYFDSHHISQEILSDKNSKNSDEIIVSWMIYSLCSGFSICEHQNHTTNANNAKTYCCII